MAEGRQYIRWDTHFADLPLGLELFERFGPMGHCLFLGFVCACKKNHIRGRISYASEAEGLAVLGYPNVELVDPQGQPFTLEDFWTFLGQRKQTRRTRRGRVTNVVSTRWEHWQKDWRRADKAAQKASSRADSTDDTLTPPTSSGTTAVTSSGSSVKTNGQQQNKSEGAYAAQQLCDLLGLTYLPNERLHRAIHLCLQRGWQLGELASDRRLKNRDWSQARSQPTVLALQLEDLAEDQSPSQVNAKWERKHRETQTYLRALHGGRHD